LLLYASVQAPIAAIDHPEVIADLATFQKNSRNKLSCLASDTLTKLVNRWPATRIDELMPCNCAMAAINV